jgi:hypothetical protein
MREAYEQPISGKHADDLASLAICNPAMIKRSVAGAAGKALG